MHFGRETKWTLRPFLSRLFPRFLPRFLPWPSSSPNGQHEGLFKVRTLDREQRVAQSKYIMPLRKDERKKAGELAVVEDMDEYRLNFDAFTHGWSTCILSTHGRRRSVGGSLGRWVPVVRA
jgi:hypothetical protein